MTAPDVVARLRAEADVADGMRLVGPREMLREAADLIERLSDAAERVLRMYPEDVFLLREPENEGQQAIVDLRAALRGPGDGT